MTPGFSFSKGRSSSPAEDAHALPRRGAAGQGVGVPPLPCQNSNNCNEGDAEFPLDKLNLLQGNHRKTAFALAFNVNQLAEKYGVNRLGFLTLTFADHVVCPKEAQRRFHSLKTGVLDKRYTHWIRVFERQKSGRIHYHLLVVLADDVRTGCDFEAFAKGDYRSAGVELRREWAFWRRTAPLYRFGRTELLPVRSSSGAMAAYVGKYIEKHICKRVEADKGVRLVSFSVGAGVANSRFAWASPGGWLWRQKLAWFAELRELKTFRHFKETFGPHWAYHLQAGIVAVKLSERPGGVVYPTKRHAEVDGQNMTGMPDDAIDIRISDGSPSPPAAPPRVRKMFPRTEHPLDRLRRLQREASLAAVAEALGEVADSCRRDFPHGPDPF